MEHDTKNERRAGRPPKIAGDTLSALLALVAERPSASVHKTLRRAGFQRQRANVRGASEEEAVAAPRAVYGYDEQHRLERPEQRYPSSLTDAEWELVAPLFEQRGPGAPGRYPRRLVLDAICYVVRSGSSWRMLPNDFPPWQNVYATFRRWTRAGLFEQMHDRLRAMWREREQRAVAPSGVIIDSQSVRSSERGGVRGFDAAKKVKGRKRHLVTDTLGLVLALCVSAADVQDRDAAEALFEQATCKYPSLQKAWADGAYAGSCATRLRERLGLDVEVVRRSRHGALVAEANGQLALPGFHVDFEVLPRRWVVERTNAWRDRPRRMAKDSDYLTEVSESWLWLTHAHILARRLAHGEPATHGVANS